MTNKNETAKPATANPAIRPGLYEVGTLDDGVIIIKRRVDPVPARPVPATERRTG